MLGTSGYTGLILLRALIEHPNVEEIIPVSTSHAGEFVSAIDGGISEKTLTKFKPTGQKLVSVSEAVKFNPDVIFAALPHLKSAEICAPFFGKSVVIDLSADFRIKDTTIFEMAYGKKPPREDLLPRAVYGLCEWYRDDIKKADIIANPGCYPTATLLPLLPLVKEKIVDGSIVTNAISGISGAGRKQSLNLLFVERSENAGAYAPGKSHRHQPEIEGELKRENDGINLFFTPHLAPLKRGIVVTTFGWLSREVAGKEIENIYRKYYESSVFIRLRGETIPQTRDVVASNRCDIGWKVEKDHVFLFSAIDNLVKGASGQAIQNMNIRFGLKESAGLRINGEI